MLHFVYRWRHLFVLDYFCLHFGLNFCLENERRKLFQIDLYLNQQFWKFHSEDFSPNFNNCSNHRFVLPCLLIFKQGYSANAETHRHKLCFWVFHIWKYHRGQPNQSAMGGSRSGRTTFLIVVKLLSQVSMLDSGSAKNQLNYITRRLLIPIFPGGLKQSLLIQNGKKQSLPIFKTIQNILHQGYWCFLWLFCSLGFFYSVEMIKTPSSGNPAFTLGKADAFLCWPYPLTKATAPWTKLFLDITAGELHCARMGDGEGGNCGCNFYV